jgi:HK97 family phage major capsid protein
MAITRTSSKIMRAYGTLLKAPPATPPRGVPATPPIVAVPAPATADTEAARQARESAARARKSEFRSFGQFLQTVAQRAVGDKSDSRLVRAPSGVSETDVQAGGFLVPDEFTSSLIGSLYEEAVIAPLCDRRQTDKPNNATLPAIDETSRADSSRWGGTLSYWEGEAVTTPTTLPKFKALKSGAHKLTALCVATEELIADVPMLDAHMHRAFAAEASFQLDRAIYKGTPGMPAGILNSAGLITVAKAQGQTAGTVIAENISTMWSRLPAPCRRRAVWLVSEDVSQQLELIGTGSPSTIGLYADVDGTPLLKGRPVIEIEQANLLGTPGDITLVDLSQYVIVDGGLQSALSLDVDFLTYQGVFRFVLRVDGMPIWQSPITPFNGSSTRSPYICLAQR